MNVPTDLEIIDGLFLRKDQLRDACVLVTGCAGFLGYTLVRYLVEVSPAAEVVGLDNFRLGRPAWLEQLERLHRPRLRVHEFDLARDSLDRIPGTARVTHVLHMASIASPVFYRKFPIETIDANVWGVRHLLDTFRGRDLRGMVFFSSSEIYGDPPADQIPTPETFRGLVATIGPRACYDESKRLSETLCYLYATEHALPVVIVRPFNNYGPGMSPNDGRAPADFGRAVVEGRDIVLFSDGSPTRTYCYVADAVAGYLQALTHGVFDVFNIGSRGPEISMRTFAERVRDIGRDVSGYTGDVRFAKPEHAAYLEHNPQRRCPCVEKARRVLQFEAATSLDDGIRKLLVYLRSDEFT